MYDNAIVNEILKLTSKTIKFEKVVYSSVSLLVSIFLEQFQL